MRDLLVVALVVTACGLTSAEFRGPVGEIFKTWDPTKDAIYVKDFDHLAPLYVDSEVHEVEHTRKKRNAAEAAHYAARAADTNAITRVCDRPGYTGQYCEFPICYQTNHFNDPEEFKTDEGFLTDITDLGDCFHNHEIIVDETMYDIRVQVQSRNNANPRIVLSDAQGSFQKPDQNLEGPDYNTLHFMNLKPGFYQINSESDAPDRCLLQTVAQTTTTISGGFSNDERDRNDFPNRNAAVHQFNSIMLHLNGQASPAELKTVHVIGTNNYVFRPRILDKRYSCQYEYYFDSMFCMVQGSYAMIVEGVDFNGNAFRRAATFQCTSAPSPTTELPPTTVVPTNPTSCFNGGVNLHNMDGTSTCICQDHFGGAQCEWPLCVNGGTLIEGKCFCSVGFEGVHCEQVRCEPNSDHGFGVDRPTLVLVVRVREQMNDILEQVQTAVDQVAENLQFDSNYFTRFHVVYFNDHNNFKSVSYSSIREFDADFFKATISGHTEGDCTDGVIGAAATALTELALTTNSYIYVVTDALADDEDDMTDMIMQWNSYYRATINFLYVDPAADSGCTADLSDPGFRAFQNIANSFGGLALHISDRTKVYNVFYNHLNSIIYKSQMMMSIDREQCGNGLIKAVNIEKRNENLVIVSYGKGFYPLVTDPAGEHLLENRLLKVVSQDYLTIWTVKDPLPGQYFLRMTANPSTAACNVRVYQASYQNPGPAQAEAFWAITTDVDQDGMMYQPLSGQDNHPVFHVENLPEQEDYDHSYAFLNMYAWRGDQEVEVYASNGMYRGGCQYHFYFPSFRCRANEKLHYEFFVRNNEGFYIQRGGVMDCYNFIPTPQPPDECQNEGVLMNGTCLCQAHFYGEHCQNVVCENGGTPGFMDQCMCSAGWGGRFCQFPMCDEAGPPPTFGYHVDMAFLVEVTKNGVEQIKQLVSALPGVLRDISSQHRDWIDRIVLIGYNSERVLGMVDAPMGNTNKIFDALTAWANSNPTDDGCVVKVWEAIFQLLNERQDGPNTRQIPRRSVVNIFEASIPDNFGDTTQTRSTSEELLERNVLTNVFQWLDPSSDNRWSCNGNQSDFVYIEQAARRGDGKMYTVENELIPSALRIIPTLFSSSIVYKLHSEDCASAEQMVYFPIDAYTQTVSAVVAGYKSTVNMYSYNGVEFNQDGRVTIYKNDMEHVVEFRNPCDEGWDSISQYCMYFNARSTMVKTYDDATAFCNAEQAFLADDLSDTKTQFFIDNMAGQKFWLGLSYAAGFGWMFQHDEGTALPVPASVNYWPNGVIPDGSGGKTCAYFDPTAANKGYWIAAACTEKYHTICQKHMFEPNRVPSSLIDDDLSPGKYYFAIQTDGDNPSGWRGCDVEVRVQSDLNVEFGFVDGIRKDNPHPVANIDSNMNRVVSSISIGQAKTDLSVLEHVILRADDAQNVMLEAATYGYRFGCSYEYYSQPLNCDLTGGNDFDVVHIGEDDTGNTFQRYSTSLCYQWNECVNGGVYSNGACVCPDYWTGEQCQTPHCQNGGQLSPDGRSCHCQHGFGGPACQFVQCQGSQPVTYSNDGKILVLIIEKSTNTADAIQSLADNLKNIVNKMNEKSEDDVWIKYFLLHTFNLNGNIEDTSLVGDVDDIITHLNQVAQEAKDMMGSCQQPVWDAIHDLFASFTPFLKGSEVLIITASAPIDADTDSVQATMELFDEDAPIIDFIHIETPMCDESSWMRGLDNFYWFFQNTGGTLFRVAAEDIDNALESFLPTRYAATKLTIQDASACTANAMYIQVDTRMSVFYVLLGGEGASVSIIAPLGEQLPTDSLFSTTAQSLWSASPRYPGIYTVTVSSKAWGCFPTVYGYGGAMVFGGFIQDDMTQDQPMPFPVYGKVNYPVFHIHDRRTGQPSQVETLYMANTYVQTVWGKQGRQFDTDLDRRIGCNFEFIGRGFQCGAENEVLTIAASGVDDYNQPFSRESIAWCKGKEVPPEESTTTAQPVITSTTTAGSTTTTTALTPATIQFDVLFIVDETEEATFLPDVAEPFVEKTMEIFTTAQRRARVGLITMPNKPALTMPVAFLSSIDNWDALDQDLISLEDFNSPSDSEYLSKALEYANSPNKYKKKDNGYRSEITNHLIVILTAKNQIADIDSALAQIDQISKENSYGVITIGYGSQTADWTQIKKLSTTDCTKIVSTKDDLMGSTVDFIQTKIWNATFNGGIYC